MHRARERAIESTANPLITACYLVGCCLTAQAPQPFHPAVVDAHFALSAEFAAIDVNRDGAVDVVSPGLFFGARISTLDEHGKTLGQFNDSCAVAANPRSPSVPRPLTLACGDLDRDGREDLVFVQPDGSVYMQRNLGSKSPTEASFAAPRVVDDLGLMLPLGSPTATVTASTLFVEDVNGDGLDDVVIGAGVYDPWNTSAGPGVLACALADGNGAFRTTRLTMPGNVIDVAWADIDGDGEGDHLVVLQEHGSVGAFFPELVHCALQGDALIPASAPLPLGNGRVTALEVGDVNLDGWTDYVVAKLNTAGPAVQSSVDCIPGNGTTVPNVANALPVSLPAVPGAGSFIPSIQVADFNRDGTLDIATLRGHLKNAPIGTTTAALDPAEIYVNMGPFPLTAQAETLATGASISYGSCQATNCYLMPLRPAPEQLQLVDLACDGNPDLMLTGASDLVGGAGLARVTVRNSTAPKLGHGAFVKVGEPSGGHPAREARIGFEGAPTVGNSTFTCTLQGLAPNCVCGLMWGTYAQENMVHVYGADLHIGATEFGYVRVTSGPPGQGFAEYALPIPNDPALIGDAGYFQFNYIDPSVAAFGGSQATGVWIGN